jgi:peptide/nickel transport system substrate-binding protein
VTFGMEQDAGGFNLANENFTGAWAAYFGETPVIRGNYTIDNKGKYLLDMASKVTATKKTLDIVIKNNANWYWQGHSPSTFPVTAADYIYTWQQFVKPGNNVASTVGYNLIYNATVKAGTNNKEVIFYWHKPFADFKDLFGYIYPKDAVSSKPWNQIWADCVCGYSSGGAEQGPISDGPYLLTNWTEGSGLTLSSNSHWYGQNPAIHTIIGKLYDDEGSEIQAMSGHEVDAIYPGQPISSMKPLLTQGGISHVIVPGFTQEHIDVEFGPAKSAQGGTHTSNGAALLKHSWFNQSLAQSLNRAAVANAVYGAVLPNNSVKPLNNPFYTVGGLSGGSYGFFKPFNYNPSKAVTTLSKHCHGGPKKPNPGNVSIWTCGGVLASINFYTTTAPARCAVAAPAWKAEAIAVGIKLNVQCYTAQPDFFTNLLPTGAFDLAEYAFVGSPDPSGWDAIYQCVTNTTGGQNYKNYCNHKVDKFIKLGDSELVPAKRTADYENAAKLVSNDVAIIPLYARPSFLFYDSNLNGLATADNPTSVGPLWHAEGWSW